MPPHADTDWRNVFMGQAFQSLNCTAIKYQSKWFKGGRDQMDIWDAVKSHFALTINTDEAFRAPQFISY